MIGTVALSLQAKAELMSAKLLIVDDSASIRTTVKRTFENAGYEILLACDGLEAIELLDEEPDLMVLDVNMPQLDGFGVCQKLKQLGPKLEQMPIVFLTVVESKAMELLGEEYGAYLNKPVTPEVILEVVEELLEQA